MATKIKVTTGDLRRAAGNIDGFAGDYQDAYKRICDLSGRLTSGTWQGVDATEFNNKVNELRGAIEKMRDLMKEYAEYLRRTAQSYEETQDNLKNQASGLKISI